MAQGIEKHVVSLELAKELNWPYPTEFCWTSAKTTEGELVWYVHRCFGANHLIEGSIPAPLLTEMLAQFIDYSPGLNKEIVHGFEPCVVLARHFVKISKGEKT